MNSGLILDTKSYSSTFHGDSFDQPMKEDLKLLKSIRFQHLNSEIIKNLSLVNKQNASNEESSSTLNKKDLWHRMGVFPSNDYVTASIFQKKTKNKVETFSSYESWVGRVESFQEDEKEFTAILQSEDGLEEIAVFHLSDVSEDDSDLLKIGAIFYWNVGQAKDQSGRISNVSTVRFRRLQHWKRDYLENKFAAAKEKYNDWLEVTDVANYAT